MIRSGVPELASTSVTGPNFSLNRICQVSASSAFISATRLIMVEPTDMRAAQRLIDGTTSLAVTGVPSCHLRPGRSLKVQVRPSGLTVWLPTICGPTPPFPSSPYSMS